MLCRWLTILVGLAHQPNADMIFTTAMTFNLSIATSTLHAFNYNGLLRPPEATEFLFIYTYVWPPHRAPSELHEQVRVGVEYPIYPSDSNSLQTMLHILFIGLRAIRFRRNIFPRAINMVIRVEHTHESSRPGPWRNVTPLYLSLRRVNLEAHQ